MSRHSLRFAACLTVGVACLVAGCGKNPVRGVKVRGQVLVDGQPLKPLAGERVWVTFERTGAWGGNPVIMTAATVQNDGTFVLDGQEGNGTPAGEYTITLHGEFSSGEGENRFAALFPNGKSPFVVDIAGAGDESFVIDLRKKTVARQ